MRTKFPFEYELTPKDVDRGMHWLTLRLRNVDTKVLTALDVKLNSLDDYNISIVGTGAYISALELQEEAERSFQISSDLTSRVYASVDGRQGDERFHWETPGILITVGEEVTELVSVFAMTEPYPSPGEVIRCEANLRGLTDGEGDLLLEFWAEMPSGEFEELVALETDALAAEEEATYAVELEPEEEGSYRVHAYLYDGPRRIGHQVDHVYVINPESP